MKTIKILSLALFSLFIIGCSISEEITFNANGSINYSYLIDASNLTEMASDKDKKNYDTIVSLAGFLEEGKDSISMLSPEFQKKLTDFKRCSLKIHNDVDKKEYFVQILGDFPNSTSLNTVLSELSRSSPRDSFTEILELLASTSYDWNGKELRKTSVVPENPENIKNDSSAEDPLYLFAGGKFRAKYHFPKKVKKVSDPSAVISQDGKSVIIEYDASEYLTSSEKNNFIIELED
ncbi:MAG: hypothetical protein LBQ84_03210 [Flavobacteriaceae bacterium]|jgi:hypothetical protein|nr:hypothetical protein [Flavobacteriaceae bacterium]